jgi:hypothetical protein
MSDFTSIITHNDFDGLASAALLSWAYDIEDVRFAGPITIANAEIPISQDDIVSDLPYPVECGMWFDHHAGNAAEVALRGIDVAQIPGRFAEAPSCVRVVFEYLREQFELPADFAELAAAGDMIDSFAYANLEEWRADTAANRVDRAIKSSSDSRREHEDFLRQVTFLMRDLPLSDIAEEPIIIKRAQQYAREEAVMLDHIVKYGHCLPKDARQEMYCVDVSGFSNPVRIDKKLIGLVQPQTRLYVELKPVFRNGRKTHDLAVSVSLALSEQKNVSRKDVSEIVRELNIGDGHAGAAAGVWRCNSAFELQKAREDLPRKILDLWNKQI